ncbi:hypothetical protein [Lacticaseibacillus thailandensis]|nr:hypothetical protein [Lacticaseibacillus thailandensis]
MKKVFALTCVVAVVAAAATIIQRLDLCHNEADDYRPFEPED